MCEPVDSVLDSLLDRQKQSWLEGHRPRVEELLADSSLKDDAEALLDLVYNEIVVREELGEQPSAEEYIRRFPHLDEELRRQFEVHDAVHGYLLSETVRTHEPASPAVPEAPALEPGARLGDYELVGELGQG